MPKLLIALRARDGVTRTATCELPQLEPDFAGTLTVHFGNDAPTAVDVSPQRMKMDRRQTERRTSAPIPLKS